ncbi:MAG: hypothetical protein IPK64_21060 [bacterium]|nr:hypothetical protein [bacterium]
MSEQTLFFKATRPDGTDFYTGTVDYAAALASGVPVEASPGPPGGFPGPGWLHLATVPTACVGMSWPCRLFEVEPVGDVHHDEDHPHKVGCREVRVRRELPAHEAFGPEGESVVALIERARRLTLREVVRLNAAWDAAWGAVGDAEWGAARGAAGDAAWDAAWDAVGDAAWDAVGDAEWGAARGAVGALVIRDLISAEHYTALTGPWRQVIGPVHPDDDDWSGDA